MVQVAQIGGRGGGGEVIWAMPKRKHFFFREGFPNAILQFGFKKLEKYHLAPPRADYEQVFAGANFNTEIVSGAPLRSPEHIF